MNGRNVLGNLFCKYDGVINVPLKLNLEKLSKGLNPRINKIKVMTERRVNNSQNSFK